MLECSGRNINEEKLRGRERVNLALRKPTCAAPSRFGRNDSTVASAGLDPCADVAKSDGYDVRPAAWVSHEAQPVSSSRWRIWKMVE
jgi:hypothetical protein